MGDGTYLSRDAILDLLNTESSYRELVAGFLNDHARVQLDADHGLFSVDQIRVAGRDYVPAERVIEARAELVARIENELDHAYFNGHRLHPDCQGVVPGEVVPAVRVSFIRAALEARHG